MSFSQPTRLLLYFLLLIQLRRGSDRATFVSTWHPASVNPLPEEITQLTDTLVCREQKRKLQDREEIRMVEVNRVKFKRRSDKEKHTEHKIMEKPPNLENKTPQL